LLKKSPWRWARVIKKRRNVNLIRALSKVFYYASMFLEYKIDSIPFLFQKILYIFSPTRQMYFYFHNMDLTFNKLFSTGVFFKKHLKCLKFFKKSINNINPLLLLFKYKFAENLDFLYYLKIKNFFKKHYIFLKKFFLYVRTKVHLLILTKSWNFTTKPKKRIKKKTYKKVAKII
jgi:hypothetical protein